jgi:hypothetical protein
MIRFILIIRRIPRIWKTGKTILIYKGGEENNPANWRPITLNGATENIHIRRGVKQGCPLSPVLFDICINPLIEKLNSRELRRFGYYWNNEDGVTTQA